SFSDICNHCQLVAIGQLALIVQSSLIVTYRFTSIETSRAVEGYRDSLPAILPHLLPGQPQRIFCIRLIQTVDQQGQAGYIVDIPAEAPIGDIPAGVAVVTITVGLQPRHIGADVQIAMLPAIAQAGAPQAVAARSEEHT